MNGHTPIFYINLSARTDRREFMEAQLAALGLTAQRVEAATIADVPADMLESHAAHNRCTPGDLACGLSHVWAWQRILEAGHEEAIILEDDAMLNPSFLNFVEPALLARMGADILKLETWRKHVLVGSLRARIEAVHVRELLSTHPGSAAYLINRAGILRTLASPMLHRMNVDLVLFGKGGPHLLRGALQAVPSPAVQLDRFDNSSSVSHSDIHPYRRRFQRKGKDNRFKALGIELLHIGRIVLLLLRDPSVLRAKRDRIAFAGDATQWQAPGDPAS